jgi:hypothetical protein
MGREKASVSLASDRHGECRDGNMTDGASRKTVSRLAAVIFMGLAFAGCAMMLTSGNQSMFADIGHYTAVAE